MLEIRDNDVFGISEDYSLYSLDLKEKRYWLFNVKDGGNFKLNEVSYFILSRCDGKISVGELKKGLINRYQVDEEIIIKDLEEFIVNCLKRQILKKA